MKLNRLKELLKWKQADQKHVIKVLKRCEPSELSQWDLAHSRNAGQITLLNQLIGEQEEIEYANYLTGEKS